MFFRLLETAVREAGVERDEERERGQLLPRLVVVVAVAETVGVAHEGVAARGGERRAGRQHTEKEKEENLESSLTFVKKKLNQSIHAIVL